MEKMRELGMCDGRECEGHKHSLGVKINHHYVEKDIPIHTSKTL